MAYIDRFLTEPRTGPTIEARRDALIEAIEKYIPDNLDDVPTPEGSDTPVIELSWVKIPDPRPRAGQQQLIEVQPILPIETIDDDSGFSSMPGVSNLMLIGRLPSGEDDLIGYMYIPSDLDTLRPFLVVNKGGSETNFTDWASADAELFLTMAEAALSQQPTDQV